LRIRSQFPFTLLFLGHAADDAGILDRGTLRLDASLDWSNTFVGSPGLRENRAPELQRQPLSEQEFDSFVAASPSKEGFFLDGEVMRTSLSLDYGLNPRLQVGMEVPFLNLGRGYMDGLIENFHQTVGAKGAGRENFPKDNVQYALAMDGQHVFSGDAEEGIGVGDVT